MKVTPSANTRAFPELKAQQTLVGRVIKEEEDSFLRTLDKGISLLDKAMAEIKEKATTAPTASAAGLILDGVQAFRLFDTYGFPLDLTELICRENGFTVDEEQFNVEMQKQGGGGGQPHFAQAGGKNADGLSSAVDKVIELAKL